MPSPRANENRDQFLDRCMGDSEMVGEFGENDHSKPLPEQENDIVFEPVDNRLTQ